MPVNDDSKIRDRVRKEIVRDDPPIEVGSIWFARGSGGSVLRRIRILAKYPGIDKDDKDWIYENLPGGTFRLIAYSMSRINEFNLRYVYRPEVTNES